MTGTNMADKHEKEVTRLLRIWKIFGIFCFLTAVGLLVALLIIVPKGNNPGGTDAIVTDGMQDKGSSGPPYPGQCLGGMVRIPADVTNPTVFQDLSPDEIQAVLQYVMAVPVLNITLYDDAVVNSSYIYSVDLQVPRKQDVMDFLDRNGARPTRSAKVVLFRGDLDPPVVEEYIVSPLPEPNHHEHVAADTYTRYPIPFDARPMSGPEYDSIDPIIDQATEDIHELLVESYDVGVINCSEKCLLFEDNTQVNLLGQGRQTWYIGIRDVEGRHLHPLGIEILVDHQGNDVTKWRVAKIFYNDQMFDGVSDMLDQYRRNNITMLRLPFPDDEDNIFSTIQRRGVDPLTKPRKGPKMYEAEGHRYQITGQHVKYMHWSFHFRLRTDSSLQVFDVRFKGDRIVYEISIQDFAAFYSGYGPNVISSHILDRSYIMTNFELVKGMDCPHEATFIDTHQLIDSSGPSFKRNIVCIFEYDSGTPLARHYANDYEGGYTYYGGVTDYALILRTIMSVYNYDYIVDFVFHLNGVVHVKVAVSGYVMATFDFSRERRYAFPVHHRTLATLHHHLFNFKVDLDIQGVRNKFATYDVEVETIQHPWFPSVNVTQTYFVQSVRETEKEARIMYDFNKPQYYVVYNENANNSFGSKQGYKIVNEGMSKLMLPDRDHVRSVRWAKYQLAVTKVKDTEVTCSSQYALSTAIEPLVDFDRFIEDDEQLEDEDLVVWITMGVHHLPTSEDVPYTPVVSKSFYLRPFNYFDEDPSVSSRDAVYIVPDEDFENVDFETYGRFDDPNCLPKKYGPLKYDGTW